jgi:hypothetical protein
LYAASGTVWIPVPEGTEQKDIHQFMTEPKRSAEPVNTNIVVQKVKGSRGNVYTVTRKHNMWSCTCMGFGYRRRCKHVTLVASGSSNNSAKSDRQS